MNSEKFENWHSIHEKIKIHTPNCRKHNINMSDFQSTLDTRKPLCVGKKTTFYKELYKNNHREFCRRFIDTIFIQHFNLFVDKCAKYRVTSAILDYKVIETDVFLWYIRDTLDSFFEFKTTGEAVCSEFITQAIDNLFDEIVNEFRIVAEFPRQKN